MQRAANERAANARRGFRGLIQGAMVALALLAGVVADAAWAFNASPVYRFYNQKTGTHFYTINPAERDNVIAKYPWFAFEGPVFYAMTSQVSGTSAVYRFYNNSTGTHFYTNSPSERDYVIANYAVFVYEGPVYYVPTGVGPDETQLYRFFNTRTGAHFYTTDTTERDYVEAVYPWFTYEGPVYMVYTTATPGNGGGGTAPKVTLVSSTTTLAAPGSIMLAAAASEAGGAIAGVSFYSGSTLIGTVTSEPYVMSYTIASVGTYSFTAVATDNSGMTGTSNAVSVSATGGGGGGNQPPKVTLASSATTVTAPATVTLTAAATDSDGSVASVAFYNGATLLGMSTSAPYTYAFAVNAAGTYALTAVATDDMGATATSNIIVVTASGGGGGNQPPKVTLAASQLAVTAPTTVTFTATATDTDGTIASVAFYQGASLLATSTTAPYTYTLNIAAAGVYSIYATATDNLGATASSNIVTVTATGGGGGNQPPKVTLAASSTSIGVPGSSLLTATATDTDGTIASVKFMQGATLLATLTSPPFTYNFSTNAAGTFNFTAIATDNLGASTTSTPVTVTATAGGGGGVVPKITLSSTSYLVNVPSTITLNATNVSSANGAITRVSFFLDGNKLVDLAAPPYQYAVAIGAPTQHTIYAEAQDVKGAVKQTLSQTVMGTVGYGQNLVAPDVVRFLNQATFGFNQIEAARVGTMGYSAWIDDQINNQPISGYPNSRYNVILLKSVPATCSTNDANGNAYPGDSPQAICARDQLTLAMMQRDFFTNALYAPDQLRQRVAWALSQILVTSGNEQNLSFAYVMSRYQSLFFNNAFGNFETLLNQVTLSPAMGDYLTMANNDRGAGARQPNQNYAREIMQLFSVGLNELNMDGSTINDATGMPVPTYGQADIIQFANVFTGWTYPTQGAPVGTPATKKNPQYYEFPMVTYPTTAASGHETASKTLLNGTVIPANQTPQQDIIDAVHNVFMHPNTAPFISRELIQRLVTGNPSPAYIQRISNVFANDGTGVRGNLAAVVKAILLDPEARGSPADPTTFGTLREPVLAITAVLRALGAQTDGNRLAGAASGLGQNPYFSPTVFNYYLPDNTIDGTMIISPEFQLHTSNTAVGRANLVFTLAYNGYPVDTTIPGSSGTQLNLAQFAPLAANPAQLVDAVNRVLTGGVLPASALATITTAVTAAPAAGNARAQMAVYLIASSYFYQVQF
jgi:uncharacterized protein (DUF1800 family)